jgi:hypothetical protein
VVAVAAGSTHTCALTNAGLVKCWGEGNWGQLGYGNTEHIGDDEPPSSVGWVELGAEAVQISAHYNNSCALLETGDVRCWGMGNSGQLGLASSEHVGDDETPLDWPPIQLDLDPDRLAVEIAVGYEHTCVRFEDDAVRCWGHWWAGQLGYPGLMTWIGGVNHPSSAADVDVGGPVAQLALGHGHTCARTVAGGMRCWGGPGPNLGYQVDAPIGDDEAPAAAGDIDLGGEVLSIAAGGYMSCAVLVGGDLRCWGEDLGKGNLGMSWRDEFLGDDEPVLAASPIDLGGNAIAAAIGTYSIDHHACALLDDGAVRCFGRGWNGSATATTSTSATTRRRPARVTFRSPVPPSGGVYLPGFKLARRPLAQSSKLACVLRRSSSLLASSMISSSSRCRARCSRRLIVPSGVSTTIAISRTLRPSQ